MCASLPIFNYCHQLFYLYYGAISLHASSSPACNPLLSKVRPILRPTSAQSSLISSWVSQETITCVLCWLCCQPVSGRLFIAQQQAVSPRGCLDLSPPYNGLAGPEPVLEPELEGNGVGLVEISSLEFCLSLPGKLLKKPWSREFSCSPYQREGFHLLVYKWVLPSSSICLGTGVWECVWEFLDKYHMEMVFCLHKPTPEKWVL